MFFCQQIASVEVIIFNFFIVSDKAPTLKRLYTDEKCVREKTIKGGNKFGTPVACAIFCASLQQFERNPLELIQYKSAQSSSLPDCECTINPNECTKPEPFGVTLTKWTNNSWNNILSGNSRSNHKITWYREYNSGWDIYSVVSLPKPRVFFLKECFLLILFLSKLSQSA